MTILTDSFFSLRAVDKSVCFKFVNKHSIDEFVFGIVLTKSLISGSSFENCKFVLCNFSKANIEGCTFTNCEFTSCTFNGTKFSGNKTPNTKFKDCTMNLKLNSVTDSLEDGVITFGNKDFTKYVYFIESDVILSYYGETHTLNSLSDRALSTKAPRQEKEALAYFTELSKMYNEIKSLKELMKKKVRERNINAYCERFSEDFEYELEL